MKTDRSAKLAVRTAERSTNQIAPHGVLRGFLKSAKRAVRTAERSSRLALALFVLALGSSHGQITTPPECAKQCGRQTVMFCQVPDTVGIGITPAEVAACRACVAASASCGASAGVAAEIQSPANGAELPSESITFTWDAGVRIENYTLAVDTRPGGAGLGSFGPSKNRSATVRMPNQETMIYATLTSHVAGGGRLEKSYSYHYPGPASIDFSGATVTQSSGTSGPRPGTNIATQVEDNPYWMISFARCTQVGKVMVRWDMVSDYLGEDIYVERQGCTSYAPVPRAGFGFQLRGTPAFTAAGPFRPDAQKRYTIALDGGPVQAIRIRKRGRTHLKINAVTMYAPVGGNVSPTTPTPPPTGTIDTSGYRKLNGTWYVNQDPRRSARIEHNGVSIAFYNEFGQASRGRFTGNGMYADDWRASAQLFDNETRITWSNGVSWYRNANSTPMPPTPPVVTSQAPRYVGCFRDTSAYDLDGFLQRSRTNTPESCVAQCRQRGFAFAGVQYGESCLCGNSYGRYGASSACTMPCTGNPGQSCGGYNANAIYSTGVAPPPPQQRR